MPNYFQNGYLRNAPEFAGHISHADPLVNALLAENIRLNELLIVVSQRNEQLSVNRNLLIAQLQQANFQLNQVTTACGGCRYSQNIHVTNQVVNITVNQNATPSDGATDRLIDR